MKKSVYESAVLINAALEDNQIESILNRIKEFISSNGGELKDMENWGRKRLAYPVEKSKIGYYAIFRFEAPTDLISKLDRLYNLDEQIYRFINLKLNKDALEQIEKNKAQSTNLKEETSQQLDSQIIPDADEEVEVDNHDKDKN